MYLACPKPTARQLVDAHQLAWDTLACTKPTGGLGTGYFETGLKQINTINLLS